MKNINKILIISCLLIISACAKQSAPMGGPVDKDPPKLLSMIPEDQSLNTKPEEIILTFDEYVKLDNANKNIIITPRINKDELNIQALKNEVRIELNQELEENTTYVFNFQKSIQDLSEGNPAENLKLVFSTGETIDSLEVNGNVSIYYPKGRNDFEDILVGLYPEGDTTDLFTGPPYYISQVDSIGNFTIGNIKEGAYRAYAWKDENNTLKAEFKTEAFDFLKDTINIEDNQNFIQFNLSLADLTEFKFQRSSISNGSYDLVLNKNPIEIKIDAEGFGETIFYTQGEKNLKLFSKETGNDSLLVNLQLADSIGFRQDTSIWAKFPQTERKPEELTLSAKSGLNFLEELQAELSFNKPITQVYYDSLYIPLDSTNRIQIEPDMLSFKDSLKRDILLINIPIPDSLELQIFSLNIADSTFQDIQNQYNLKPLIANYRRINPNTLADKISGSINAQNYPLIVQLLNQKGEVHQEKHLNEESTFSFENIEAGTYTIRVIEDMNENRRWDPASFYENRQAEKVYYYLNEENKSKEIIIKSGWTTEDLVINPSKSTGIIKNNSVDNREIEVDNLN